MKTLVAGESPERLRIWVDAADAPVGDLLLLDRLVLAVEAYGHERWVDCRQE